VNLTCLKPAAAAGQPGRVSLRDLCREFLDFRMNVVTRRLEFEKRKLEARLHILDGFHKIYADLDKAIRIIRRAESRADAATKLKEAFDLDDVQVDAILELRLYQLARLEIDKLESERDEKRKRLAEVNRLLKSEKLRWKLIRDELEDVAKRHGDARRTKVSTSGRDDLAYDPDAYVVHEEATVVLTRDGWIRRVRELRDPSTARLREGDAVAAVLPGSTRDRVVLFSSRGVLYVLPVTDVPATTGYGEPVQSLFRFGDGERVIASLLLSGAAPAPEEPAPAPTKSGRPQRELFSEEDGEVIELAEETIPLLVASARGYGFRTSPDLSATTRSGRRFARVGEGDALVSVERIEAKEVACLAESGKGMRIPIDEVSELSGVGRGVILMRLDAKDRLLGALSLGAKDSVEIGIEGAKERVVEAAAFPRLHRGGKGQKVVKRGTPTFLRRPKEA